MMITRKRWCIFLSAESKRSKTGAALFFCVLLFQAVSAEESIRSLQTDFAQKNPHGPQYQLGDRIQLSVGIPLEISQQLTTVQLKNPDDNNPLDKAGWYLDGNPQVIDGNLRFIVSPIKSGKLVLPSLLILKDGVNPVAKTTALNVDVAEMKANPSETPSYIDVISISLPLKYIILAFLIAFVLALSGIYLYRRYMANRPAPVVEEIKLPPVPDHIIALKDLELLYEQYPYSKENLKPVAFGVSQILKNFFSARFKIDAKESTTGEMLALLKKESLPDYELKRVRALYDKLDIIKFTELNHHEHFEKSDYLEFKEVARALVDAWAVRGETK